MPRRKVLLSQLFAVSLVSASLFGCGSGGSDSGSQASSGVTMKGVAAEGAAIANATITIKDANGASRSATTDDNGNFSFSTAGLTFPLMLKVAGSGGTYYTVLTSDDVDKRVNMTNFTHAIAQLALNAADDAALEASFNSGEFRAFSGVMDALPRGQQQDGGSRRRIQGADEAGIRRHCRRDRHQSTHYRVRAVEQTAGWR